MDIVAWQFEKPAANKKIEHLLAIVGVCVWVGVDVGVRAWMCLGTCVRARTSTLDNFALPDNFVKFSFLCFLRFPLHSKKYLNTFWNTFQFIN